MTISICRNCLYEQGNCKGNKSIDRTQCDYFKEKLAINYPARIKELEYELDIYQAKAYEYDKLYDKYAVKVSEYEELKAENETLMQKNTNEYKLNEALLLRADRFEAERNELKAKLKQADEAYDSQGEQLLEALDEIEKLKELLENADHEIEWLNSSRDSFKFKNARLIDENSKLKAKIEERVECGADCDKCKNKCRAWQNGFNAKGGNISFDSIQMLRRIVKEVEPEWIDNNCISCAWFNNLKGVGGYCAYHNNKTTAKGGCNKWTKECDTE